MDRKVPESHLTSFHANAANGKTNNPQSTVQPWI